LFFFFFSRAQAVSEASPALALAAPGVELPVDIPTLAQVLLNPHSDVVRVYEAAQQFRKILSIGA